MIHWTIKKCFIKRCFMEYLGGNLNKVRCQFYYSGPDFSSVLFKASFEFIWLIFPCVFVFIYVNRVLPWNFLEPSRIFFDNSRRNAHYQIFSRNTYLLRTILPLPINTKLFIFNTIRLQARGCWVLKIFWFLLSENRWTNLRPLYSLRY